MPYTIRHNARTAHLEGIPERTTGGGFHYAQSACAALTRSGYRMSTADELDTLADALDALRYFAECRGLKVCANCERAAVAGLESAYDIAELEARSAAGQLEAAENFADEPRIAAAEERAERAADRYADLAAAIGRCRIIGCERPTHEASAWCQQHTEPDDIASAIEAETAARHEADNAARMIAATDDTHELPDPDGSNTLPVPGGPWFGVDPAVAAAGRASTFGKAYTPANAPYTGCEARIYHDGVGSPCGRPRGHEGPNGAVHRTTTGIEWMNEQTRPLYCPYARTMKGCEDCKEHAALVNRIMESGKATTHADAEAVAVAMEEEPEAFAPLTVDPEAAYAARRAIYRTASDLYEEHGGTVNRDATAAAWDAFVAAARLAGKCIDFTCYADAAPGADHCQRHHKPVTATLDHTEPGHAVAILTGGHGREHAPQAWLAHEGGAWLLVDDYDGDTLNVKGPDAERAVHAWAALLGLRIDALTVEVEYAGGPVSPPVRAPQGPAGVTLEWRMTGSDSAAHVFDAHGHAHDYRIRTHPDGSGASLRAVLRGTEVETYSRGYTTTDGAREAAQHYETRYGSAYVPVR